MCGPICQPQGVNVYKTREVGLKGTETANVKPAECVFMCVYVCPFGVCMCVLTCVYYVHVPRTKP